MVKQCAFCYETEDRTLIEKRDFWTIYANYSQPTLGSVVIALNRHEEQVSGVSLEEDVERHYITKDLEKAIRNIWNHDYANNFMLANKVRHVHYHFVPRYADSRDFAGKNWKDETFGSMPNIKAKKVPEETLNEVITAIKKEISRIY